MDKEHWDNPGQEAQEDFAPRHSEEAIALNFAQTYCGSLHYVSEHGRWMIYDGKRWAPDKTLHTISLVRSICRMHANNAPENRCREIASARTVAAVERLARADDRLWATADQWDADPWLLNTPDGIVDLRIGARFPNHPDHLMTKLTGAVPSVVNSECPLWRTFLDRISGGDPEFQHYLARVFGYCLTGWTKEQALFFFFGLGANGKSVLIDTMRGILGDYSKGSPMETFTASPFERHSTDIADLQGARLVTAVETEEGRVWAEAKIKALTGGDPITARFMRKDNFEFVPQFKLLIAGNHKPGLRNVDEAIRRRFHLVPFNVIIPAAERDLSLREKLKAEWPGILAWMIAGCREWQRVGLNPPEVVRAATQAYLRAEDAVTSWISECCIVDPHREERSSDLFISWRAWAERAGEPGGSRKKFTQALEAHGCLSRHTRAGTRVSGLSLVQRTTGEPD